MNGIVTFDPYLSKNHYRVSRQLLDACHAKSGDSNVQILMTLSAEACQFIWQSHPVVSGHTIYPSYLQTDIQYVIRFQKRLKENEAYIIHIFQSVNTESQELDSNGTIARGQDFFTKLKQGALRRYEL
jgi:hypothetical protein